MEKLAPRTHQPHALSSTFNRDTVDRIAIARSKLAVARRVLKDSQSHSLHRDVIDGLVEIITGAKDDLDYVLDSPVFSISPNI